MEDVKKLDETQFKVSRRTFVKAGAATATVSAVSGLAACTPKEEDEVAEGTMQDPFAAAEVFYTSCPPECQHHNLKGYVLDGKLVKIESSEHNQSKACARGLARIEMVQSDQRLTVPLLRDGEKGEGKWKEISWDEAFDLIAEKLQTALDERGNEAISYFGCAGNFCNIAMDVGYSFFSYLGGYVPIVGNNCCAAVDEAMIKMFGNRQLTTRQQFKNSDYIIAWGNNPAITLGGYFPWLESMRENGGTLVTIDPRFSETATNSDLWVAPLPGSDSALALGMIKIILDENLYDKDYLLASTTAPCLVAADGSLALEDPADESSFLVYDTKTQELARHDKKGVEAVLTVSDTPFASEYTTQFDLIAAEAAPWTAEAVEQETRVSASQLTELAHGYAAAEHAMIIQNMGGFMRTEYGSYAVATQFYLALLTGNVGHEGDGIYDPGGASDIIAPRSPFVDVPETPDFGSINLYKFGDEVLEDKPSKIDFLWVTIAEMVSQGANASHVIEGLKHIPFVVVSDLFMTATAEWADLVLPVTGQFETEDIMFSCRSNYVQICEKAVEGPGESKSDLDIFRGVAERLGFGDKLPDAQTCIKNVLEGTGIDYEELKEKKAINAAPDDFIPFEDGVFYTASGKAELYQPSWLEQGFNPIATHIRPKESYLNASTYPLACVQRKTRRSVHSTFNNLEVISELEFPLPTVTMNTVDAEARGIANGDTVTLFNDRGEHTAVAVVGPSLILPGVVAAENGWGKKSSSFVVNDEAPTLGDVYCCNSTLVEVRKGE